MHGVHEEWPATERALHAFIDALQEFILLGSALETQSIDARDSVRLDTDLAAQRAVDLGRDLQAHVLALQRIAKRGR